MSTQLTVQQSVFKSQLITKQKSILSILGGDVTKSNKFLATAMTLLDNPKIAECTTESILDACVSVAQMGLELAPVYKHFSLVPFSAKVNGQYVKKVQLIVDKRGYIYSLSQMGWKIKSFIVHIQDEFSYEINGFDEKLHYKRNLDDDTLEFRYAVAIARSITGDEYYLVMNKSEIEKRRLKSNSQKANQYTKQPERDKLAKGLPVGVWEEWYDEMALKTVLKKLADSLPLGSNQKAAELISYNEDEIVKTSPVSTIKKEAQKEIEVPIDNFEEVVEEVEIEPTTGEVNYSQDDINKFIQKHKNTHLQQLQEVLGRGLDINSTMFELQQCLNS